MDGEQKEDPRFARLSALDESLRAQVAGGRIDLQSANSLSWLSPGEQKRVARWIEEDARHRLGPLRARRLLKIKQEGGNLDYRTISHALRPRKSKSYIAVPMSKLPQGLSRKQAEQWLDQAIREHKSRRR